MSVQEAIRNFLPLIIIELVAVVAALGHLIYKKNTRNLNVWAWAAIIIIFNLFGSLAYFLFGRSED
jgi:hypothetical protein